MSACRRISGFAKQSKTYLFKPHKLYSTGAQVTPEAGTNDIVIPYRIERGPTDILQALATTISKDFTAPHYKYEDDPYLIPSSNVTKRAFALSKESGKRAAHYFLEKFPELFECNQSAPHIKAFNPPIVYTEDNVTTVDTLTNCIAGFDVDNSITVYNILEEKGIAVKQEIKQDLLELLCFYNNKQPIPDEYFEERFYSRSDTRGEKWNLKGMAEKLFQEMEKDNKAYSAMISGTAKFLDAERAMSLYAEMREKGFIGTANAYNNLLSTIHLHKEDSELQWEMALQLLGNMSSDGLKPDVYTMNSLLKLVSRNARWKKCLQTSLKIFSEMKKLNIEPSLGSYQYLLWTFCSNDFSKAKILYEIMSYIEDKEFIIRHPSDVSFFVTAMEACWKGTGDKVLGYRIHKLLEHKNNCKLLGNALAESQYFKCLFRLLCETEDMDKFMEFYEKYVPNTYTPEPSVTLAIIQAIHFSGCYKHLPKLCSDVLFFEQTERENVLQTLMDAAGCMKHEEKLQTDLINMVWNILQKLKTRDEVKRLPFDFTGILLGNFLKTFMNGKDLEKSWTVIMKMKEDEYKIIGYPEKSCLLKFCELCLENGDYDKLNYCMTYAINGCYLDFREDVENLAKTMFERDILNEKQRAEVMSVIQFTSTIDDSSGSSSESSSSDDSSSDDDEKKPDNRTA